MYEELGGKSGEKTSLFAWKLDASPPFLQVCLKMEFEALNKHLILKLSYLRISSSYFNRNLCKVMSYSL